MVSTELINAKDSSLLGCSSCRLVPAVLNDRSANFMAQQFTNLNASVCLSLRITY